MDCNLLLLFFSIRPGSVLRRAVTLISVSLLVLGLYIAVNTKPSPAPEEVNECVIKKYVVPPESTRRKECFLQQYCLKYRLQPNSVCDEGDGVRLFIFIFSLPSNFHRRQMIRDTWLDRSLFRRDQVRHVFLLGYDESSNYRRIRKEARRYDDIAVMDLQESFCYLTLKGIAGLRFASSRCPSAKFVMKTDDDIFINMFLLQWKLDDLVAHNQSQGVIMGLVWYEGLVIRNGRYAVSKLQYAHSTFPPFCSGSGYTMSMDVTEELYRLAMQDRRKVLLHLDDPYITGVLAHRARLKHTQLRTLYLMFKRDYDSFTDTDLLRHLVLHLHDEHVIVDRRVTDRFHLQLWRRLVKLNKNGRFANNTDLALTEYHKSIGATASRRIVPAPPLRLPGG